MKTKLSWMPGRKNAGRSFGTARVDPGMELFKQISRVHATMH